MNNELPKISNGTGQSRRGVDSELSGTWPRNC